MIMIMIFIHSMCNIMAVEQVSGAAVSAQATSRASISNSAMDPTRVAPPRWRHD